MSGGRFDHLWYKVTDSEKILTTFDSLQDCEEFLRSRGQQFAADEILRYRLELETRYHQLFFMGERLEPLLYAAEWWASGDWGKDQFEKAWKEYMETMEKRKNDRLDAVQVVADAEIVVKRLGKELQPISHNGMIMRQYIYSDDDLSVEFNPRRVVVRLSYYGEVFEADPERVDDPFKQKPYRFNYGQWVGILHNIAVDLRSKDIAELNARHADMPDWKD